MAPAVVALQRVAERRSTCSRTNVFAEVWTLLVDRTAPRAGHE
jgi:hypothetical protein